MGSPESVAASSAALTAFCCGEGKTKPGGSSSMRAQAGIARHASAKIMTTARNALILESLRSASEQPARAIRSECNGFAVGDPIILDLAIQRRPSDPEAAGDLAHPPPVMSDRKPYHFLLECTDGS